MLIHLVQGLRGWVWVVLCATNAEEERDLQCIGLCQVPEVLEEGACYLLEAYPFSLSFTSLNTSFALSIEAST